MKRSLSIALAITGALSIGAIVHWMSSTCCKKSGEITLLTTSDKKIEQVPDPLREKHRYQSVPQVVSKDVARVRKAGKLVTSFGSSLDLWKVAVLAKASDDVGIVYEGYAAAKECQGLMALQEPLQNFAAGVVGTPIYGELTVARQQAVSALITRCNGFLKVGPGPTGDLVAELQRRGQSLGGPEFSKPSDQPRTPEVVSAYIATLSSAASIGNQFQDLFFLTTSFEAADQPAPVSERSLALRGVSAMLAMCDLGRDCSADAWGTQFACAISARCGTTLWDRWEEGLSSAEIAAVNDSRRKLVAMISSRR